MAFSRKLDTADMIQLGISYIIRLALVLAVAESVWFANWWILFVSSTVLILTFMPALIERNYKIHLPLELEFMTTVFVYATIFLGEVYDYYIRVWWWDIVVHGVSAIALGLIGFLVLYLLYHHRGINARPFVVALFSFCFAVAIGVMWEIVEFSMDGIFGMNMQKSGLVDTMWDLIVNAGGAFLAAIMGYFYLKKGSVGLVNRIVQKLLRENPRFM